MAMFVGKVYLVVGKVYLFVREIGSLSGFDHGIFPRTLLIPVKLYKGQQVLLRTGLLYLILPIPDWTWSVSFCHARCDCSLEEIVFVHHLFVPPFFSTNQPDF